MAKTTILQKIGLFFFAFILTLGLLEGGLRLSGWFFLAVQEKANRQGVSFGSEYRILCLGESTTALGGDKSYPRQLEEILNSRQSKIKFKVINKGVPATTTDQILTRAPGYFIQYQPNMVVAMMGINDPQTSEQWTWRDQFSKYSKAFKLLDMIVRHWTEKQKEVSRDFIEHQIAKLDSQAVKNPALLISIEIGKANLYRSANFPQKEKASLEKVLALDPENSQAWFLMGIHYEREAEYQKAFEAYIKAAATAASDGKIRILERIAECQKFRGNENAAVEVYIILLKQWPRHPQANGALADILMGQEKYEEALNYFLRQAAIDPKTAELYDKIAYCYRKVGQSDNAQRVLSQHQEDESLKLKKGSFNSGTKNNYLKLVRIAQQYNVPLLVVQYPNRPIGALKDMVSPTAAVTFVDNQKIFFDALAQHPYDEIFIDRFAGDFGHCTPRGNALLAEHVAEEILKLIR